MSLDSTIPEVPIARTLGLVAEIIYVEEGMINSTICLEFTVPSSQRTELELIFRFN